MNNIKAILLDADGLLLKKQRYFSEIFSEQYNVPAASIVTFFKTKFRDCQRGSADIKEELVPFLKEWNWAGSLDEFLDYWFSSCTEVDNDVLEFVQKVRKNGIKCYLATDQEKYRGEYIKKNLALENNLDGFFYSYETGCSKSEKEFFDIILNKLNLSPEEVIFLDDEKENVEVANDLGIVAIHIIDPVDIEKIEFKEKQKKNCIMIHGCPSNEEKAMNPETRTYDKHWMPWLKKKLAENNIPTYAPLMPSPWRPVYEDFKKEFEKYEVNENTILIGHSCGCSFLVRWLGETKQKVSKLILVAPWKINEAAPQWEKEFYEFPIDKGIPERVDSIIMFTSNNEDEDGKKGLAMYHDAIGGKIIDLENHGHYTMGYMGTEEFPELLDIIIEN